MTNNTMASQFISRDDLIEMGFKKGTATDYIHQAQNLLVARGFTAYNRNRLMVVPKKIMSEILAVEL